MRAYAVRFVFLILSVLFADAASADPSFDTGKIETITGLKGAWNDAEKVFKVTSPRNDVKVSVDTVAFPPFMGLTSWAAFTPATKDELLMVMGDLVLFQDEVNPVMSALLDDGLQVTALHNHFFYEDPKVYFMHIGGEGSLDALSKSVRHALDTVKRIRTVSPTPAKTFGAKPITGTSSITPMPLETILGQKLQAQNGMAKAVIGRSVKMSCGCPAGKDMGVNTWAAFLGTDDNALVDGDFAVLQEELQPVLKELRHGGINIVAIHHHMVEETPRMLFLHYWGRGPAKDLARAVANALKLTSAK